MREVSRTLPAPEGGTMHLCPRCDTRLTAGWFRQEEIEYEDEHGTPSLGTADVQTWDCPGCGYAEDR